MSLEVVFFSKEKLITHFKYTSGHNDILKFAKSEFDHYRHITIKVRKDSGSYTYVFIYWNQAYQINFVRLISAKPRLP